ESKHFGQPFKGGNAILIGQKRNHVWHLVLLSPCHEGFEHQTRTMALPSRPCRRTSVIRRTAQVSTNRNFWLLNPVFHSHHDRLVVAHLPQSQCGIPFPASLVDARRVGP